MTRWWYIICNSCGFNSGGLASDQEEATTKFNECPRCKSADITVRKG